jgi:hypothetical protein
MVQHMRSVRRTSTTGSSHDAMLAGVSAAVAQTGRCTLATHPHAAGEELQRLTVVQLLP